MLKRKLAASVVTALAVAVLVPMGAQSASAYTITTYCAQHMSDNTQSVTPAPSTALYCQMQEVATWYGYTGPVNGTLGVNSWLGVQKYLADWWGYTGPQNGVPGTNTYKAMQRAGNSFGWWGTPGPVDGSLDTRDWQAWGYVMKNMVAGD